MAYLPFLFKSYIYMSKTLKESWGDLATFIVHRNSLDLGALNRILQQLTTQTPDEPAFTAQVQFFLQTVSSQAKSKTQLHAESLALMAIEAVLYNMYNAVRGNEGFKPASSSFYGFMSMSHLSAEQSESSHLNETEPRKIIGLIEHLASSESFIRRVKIVLDRTNNRERNHRYGENLMETISHILTKEKSNREAFNRLRSKNISLSVQTKNKPMVDYRRVNEIIFSNELNKVRRLLSEGSDEVHLALLRIYWAERESRERKQLEGSNYSGEEVLYNLQHYYVESFEDENELFEESKHPLFRLIRNHLLLFFTPYLQQFHAVVARFALKGDVDNSWAFYKSAESALREELLSFISSTPGELVRLLRSLFGMIEGVFGVGKEACGNLVKKLLFYSFLCSQPIIEDLLPNIDPAKYSHIYNHIINLFFQTSLRKFVDLPPQKLTLITALVQEVSSAFDSKILQASNQVLQEGLNEPSQLCFSIKDPILNYDYELVHLAQEKIEFTPKDSKKFTMLKEAAKAIESPIYKHFRKETSINVQSEQGGEADLATWMSVGGSRDWGAKPKSLREKPSAKEALKGLRTLRGEKVKELDRLRSEFQYYL